MSVTDGADTADGVRLRHRPLPHQLAAWWGFVGAVALVAMRLGPWWGGFPGSAVAGGKLLLYTAVAAGVPAVGAWLAAHPSRARAQAGLVILATWGLLAVPALFQVIEPLTQQHPVSLFSVVAFHAGRLIPLVGLALAGWALARGEGLAWRYPASWGHRLAGLGVAVYGVAAVLPPAPVPGPPAGVRGGYWQQLLGDPWGLASSLVLLVLVAALGVAVARLDVALALGPAAIVAVHAVARVAELFELARPIAPGGPSPSAATVTLHPAFIIHIVAALAAVGATAWLATRVRRRSTL